MEIETETIGISFVLPEDIVGELTEIHNKLIQEFSERPETDYAFFSPHVTIYHVPFPKKNEENVIKKIQAIAARYRSIYFRAEGVNIKWQFVGIKFEKTKAIEALHEAVITELSPFREGVLKSKYRDATEKYTEKELEYINQWGYPHVMDNYQPHVSLLTLENEHDATKAAAGLHWEKEFTVDTLMLFISYKNPAGIRERKITRIRLGTGEIYENN